MADQQNPIVTEMIARLRELQGSGEFVPIGRIVATGAGMIGGGDLTNDRTLEVDPELRKVFDRLKTVDPTQLASVGDVAEVQATAQAAVSGMKSVFYRDFTVAAAPASQVSAPPIRVDVAATITRVTVVVASPSTRPVTATVAGESITVAAGKESATKTVKVARAAGASLPLTVAATDASGIVVSVRFEEAG